MTVINLTVTLTVVDTIVAMSINSQNGTIEKWVLYVLLPFRTCFRGLNEAFIYVRLELLLGYNFSHFTGADNPFWCKLSL